MKNLLKNNKGFTLIELLAVIVVLSIIMMIATTNVTSIVADTKKSGFASTADTVISAASAYALTQEMLGSEVKSCYSVETLINSGYLTKMSTEQYFGSVKITTENGIVTYTLFLQDTTNNFYVDGFKSTSGVVTGESVYSADKTGDSNYSCN